MRFYVPATFLAFTIPALAAPWLNYGKADSQTPLSQSNTTLSTLTLTTQKDAGWYLHRISQVDAMEWGEEPPSSKTKRQLSLNFTWRFDPNWGKGVLVYVLDSGVSASHHTFFPGQVQPGMVVTRLKTLPNNDPHTDETNHGTGVASLIAGQQFGVARAATLIPIKVDNKANNKGKDNNYTLADITEAINLATADFVERQENNIGLQAVINISWTLRHGVKAEAGIAGAAIKSAIEAGMHVVNSAGNDEENHCFDNAAVSPSDRRVQDMGQITVSGVQIEDCWQYNCGKCVDLVAPAADIVCASGHHATGNITSVKSGTSFAAPLVAGTIAALLSTEFGKNLSPAAMKNLILSDFTTHGVQDIPRKSGSPDRLLVITELLGMQEGYAPKT